MTGRMEAAVLPRRAWAGLALALIGSPALAQHEGHAGHAMPGAAADPHAGHAMPEAPADPHAGHAMPETPADPHAGHAMPGPEADPHARHAMPEAEPGPHAGHGAPPASGPPPAALSGPAHAADTVFGAAAMAPSREALPRELGGMTTRFVGIDRLELQAGEDEESYLWEANGWFGGDIDRLWIKTEGEGEFGGELEEAEVQALWSHAIGPWFDLQAGVRYDIRPEPDRAHAVIGVQGLAPYFFEIDAAAFLSDEGDVTARFEAEYDQRITQRLILQPRLEIGLAAQDIPELGIGAGVSGIEAGLRLRYEIVPEFAPYVGVEWQRALGDTADYARAAGDDPDRLVALAGVRLWF